MRFSTVFSSVRFRVTALAAVGVLLVLTVTGAALVLIQRQVLLDGLEERAAQQIDSIAADLRTGRLPTTPASGDDDDTAARVTTPEGAVVWSSGAGGAADEPDDAKAITRTVSTGDGPRIVEVTVALDDVDDATRVLSILLLLLVPLVVGLLTGLVWWLVGRTLEPVEAIRNEASAIGGDVLHRRVPEPTTHDEIGRLARTMNAMLDRIESASARQQQFVADASHELRGPLTRMRSELEVDLRHPGRRDPEVTERSVLEETVAMQRLVDDLLFLARSDAGVANTGAHAAVDLDDIVLTNAARWQNDGVHVGTAGVAPVRVLGDARALDRAIGNVVENAARHAASQVELTLATEDGSAILTVSDDGAGLPIELQQTVFERFARADDARSRSTGGTGLGLAIARDIVEQHGGTIRFDPEVTEGAAVVIQMPWSETN